MFYSKYSASGNDFVIFSAWGLAAKATDRAALAKRLCDRQNGIGADGLIALKPHAQLDFEWEFYNSDGSIAAMCGNGARAAALYACENKIAGASMRFLTLAGEISASVGAENIVTAQLTPHKILQSAIAECGETWRLIDAGVPHLTLKSDDLGAFDRLPIAELRRKYDANVNVFSVRDGAIFVRTFERGVEGETLACGTGMAACFISALEMKLAPNPAKIYPKSGEELQMQLRDGRLFFSGKVRKIFDAIV